MHITARRGAAALLTRGRAYSVAAAALTAAGGHSVTRCSAAAHQQQDEVQPPQVLQVDLTASTATSSSSSSSSSSSALKRRLRRCSHLAAALRRRIVKALRCLVRLVRHAMVLGPAAVSAPVALLLASPRTKEAGSGSGTEWWWRLLTRSVERSGPAAVKFAQWASTRRDLFPEEFCDHAARLQDRVEHRPTAANSSSEAGGWRLAQEELHANMSGVSAGEVQLELHREEGGGEGGVEGRVAPPIASGSVAQVYRGRLRRRGGDGEGEAEWREVAVKVINPSVRREIELDLGLMRGAAAVLESLPLLNLKWLAISEAVGQFGDLMANQLDCQAEADALRQFRADFHCDDTSGKGQSQSSNNKWHVTFPEPLLASRHVLVESFERGLPISALTSSSGGGGGGGGGGGSLEARFKRRIAECGLGAFLTMLFRNNLAHGDLHPGNILIRRKRQPPPRAHPDQHHGAATDDGSDDNLGSLAAAFAADEEDFELVMLDAGIVCRLARYDQESLLYLFKSIVDRDGARAGELMLERSKREECADRGAFCRGIASIVDGVVPDDSGAAGAGLRLSVVQVSQILGSVLGLCCSHQVLLEANFAAVVAAIGVMEGLGRSLHPDLDIITEARPIITSAVLSTGLGFGSRERTTEK